MRAITRLASSSALSSFESAMAKADLSDAIAALDWADRQIYVLAAEVAQFLETKPYTVHTERQPDGQTAMYLKADKPVTKLIASNVAAILASQRSSLDYLAVALAKANGAIILTDTYFPVVKT